MGAIEVFHGKAAKQKIKPAPKVKSTKKKSSAKTVRPNEERFESSVKPASKWTTAKPGSADKIKIMQERIARGEALFHPQDAR